MAKNVGQAARDVEAQPQAVALMRLAVVDAVEFLEDCPMIFWRNAHTGIGDDDPQVPPMPPASHQNPADLRIANGIADEIRQDSLKQHAIAHDCKF